MGGANSLADDLYDARIIRVHGFNPHIQENLSAWRFLRPTSYQVAPPADGLGPLEAEPRSIFTGDFVTIRPAIQVYRGGVRARPGIESEFWRRVATRQDQTKGEQNRRHE
jgi:hypothetical protein